MKKKFAVTQSTQEHLLLEATDDGNDVKVGAMEQ